MGFRVSVAGGALALAVVGCAVRLPMVAPAPLSVEDAAFSVTLEGVTGAPVVGGNRVDVLLNGDEIFPAILDAIRAARTTITYAQYFYEHGTLSAELFSALAERCRAGVAVHVLLDGFGAAGMPAGDAHALERAGCGLAYFRAAGSLITGRLNHRNHRRILVVDGRVGFTGGSGIADKWLGNGRTDGRWRDTDVRIEGPAVRQLQTAFVNSWEEATGVVLAGAAYFPPDPEAPGSVRMHIVTSSPAEGDYALYTAILLAIRGARRSIQITNPYFVPDDAMRAALEQAVARGVRVELLVPGALDSNLVRAASRAGFGPLLESGVLIYEYLPALLHAKTMIVDGAWSTIGSANLDPRSFGLNAEMNAVIYDRTVAERMQAVFAADLSHARRIRYVRWQVRPFWRRLLEVLAIPFHNEL